MACDSSKARYRIKPLGHPEAQAASDPGGDPAARYSRATRWHSSPHRFRLLGRTSEARRQSAARPESHGKPEQSQASFPPPLPPSRSCRARTPMISSAVSWVPETQPPALHSGLLRPVTVASPKICPPTPRTPLHTVCQPLLCPAAMPQSLARGLTPPTVLCSPAPPGPPGRRPRALRTL